MSTSLLSNLILRCTKVWEDYVEVEWRREFSDGRRTVQFVLKAEAPDLRLSKQLDSDKRSYRISGLPSRCNVFVSVQIEVAERDGSTSLLPPVSVTARTLTCCMLEVGSVLPDRLHTRISRFPDPEMQRLRNARHQDDDEDHESARQQQMAILDGDVSAPADAAAAAAAGPLNRRRPTIAPGEAPSGEQRTELLVPSTADGSGVLAGFDNEVPVSKYQLQVTQIGRVLSHECAFKEFEPNADGACDYFLEGVECNARFTAKCRAVSIFGDLGRWSPLTRFLTLLPVRVEVMDVGESEIALAWGRGDGDDAYFDDACIENLTVEVELLPSQKEIDLDAGALPTHVDTKVFSNEVRRYTIKGLESGRTYRIRTRYCNILGDTSAWDSIKATTLFPVEPCEIVVVGTNFIHVRWRRSEPTQHDTVSVRRPSAAATAASESSKSNSKNTVDSSNDNDVAEWEVRCAVGKQYTSAKLPGKESETRLTHLSPGVEYAIDVRAITKTGRVGQWSPVVSATVLHALQPRLVAAGESWIKVAWDRKETMFRDNIERFHVQLNCVSSPFRVAKYFSGDITRHTFRDLKPNTRYQVSLQSFSDGRWGPWGAPTSVATCSVPVPRLVRRGEEFVQVQWSSDYYEKAEVDSAKQVFQVRTTRHVASSSSSSADAPATGGDLEVSETIVDRPTFRASKLKPLTMIDIKVRSFDYSTNDWGSWGPSITFRTLPAAVVVTHIGETVAEVSWSRIPALYRAVTDEQLAAGAEDPLMPAAVAQYQLRINRIVEEASSVRDELHCTFYAKANQPTSFVIPDLAPDTDYSVQIAYLDSEEDGHWSVFSCPVYFSTVPRLRLDIREIGEARCVLQWGRNARKRMHKTSAARLEEQRLQLLQQASASAAAGGADAAGWLSDPSATYRVVLQDIVSEHLHQQQLKQHREHGGGGGADAIGEAREKALPLQYTVRGETALVVTELKPNTAYRAEISCSSRNTSWGTWSEPIHFMTLPPLSLHIMNTGETFLRLKWVRAERSSFLTKLFPGLHMRTVGAATQDDVQQQQKSKTATGDAALTTGAAAAAADGAADESGDADGGSTAAETNVVWVQGNADREFELQCQRLRIGDSETQSMLQERSAASAAAASPAALSQQRRQQRALGGNGVTPSATALALLGVAPPPDPNRAHSVTATGAAARSSVASFVELEPDTTYTVKIRSRLARAVEWSAWSEPITAKTALATQVRVVAAGVDGVTLGWGFDTTAVEEEERRAAQAQLEGGGGDRDDRRETEEERRKKAEAQSHNFELEIKGFDDNLALVRTVKAQGGSLMGQTTFQLNGLNIGCCYGARARRQDRQTQLWGNFCSWHYFALKVYPVQLVETSQDWVHVRWEPFTVPPACLILTLTGDSQGHAIHLKDTTATEYAFTGLVPDTPYAVRLLAVLDRPRHDADEFEQQKRLAQNRPRRQAAATATAAHGGDGEQSAASNQNEVHGAPFSLPLVSSDYFRFAMSGLIARTKKILLARFERVGQTFAVLSWVADGDIKTSSFEVQVNLMNGNEVVKTRSMLVHGCSTAVIKDLAPESRIQCSVRAVTRSTGAATSWCAPVEIVLLPRLSMTLNHARIENSETQPPVGENYISVSWGPDCASPDVTFEVRIVSEEDEEEDDAESSAAISAAAAAAAAGAGVHAGRARAASSTTPPPALSALRRAQNAAAATSPQSAAAAAASSSQQRRRPIDAIFETKEMSYTFQGLSADTRYTIQVRSKTEVVTESGRLVTVPRAGGAAAASGSAASSSPSSPGAGSPSSLSSPSLFSASANSHHRQQQAQEYQQFQSKELCLGAWSEPFVKATLSPLAITVQNIRENSSVAFWCRRARVRGTNRWWETSTAADRREDVASISAFQINVYERMRDSNAGFRMIVDDVIPDNQIDFQQCSRVLSMLRPGAEYEVCIRANTGLQWGRWSERCRFATKPTVQPVVSHVRESACLVEWELAATLRADGAMQPAAHYIARVTTVRTGDFETVPLLCAAAKRDGYCVLSGFEPNTAYSLCLKSHFADGDSGPWGPVVYFVTQAPLAVDVGNVSESFANIIWRRVPQRTIGEDLREQRMANVAELDKQIERMTAKRMRKAHAALGASAGLGGAVTPSTSGFFSAPSSPSFGSPLSASQAESAAAARTAAAKLDAALEALVKRREGELELMEMHAAQLDDLAVYPEGRVAHVEVSCENLATNELLETRTLDATETFCRQADLVCNTQYLVRVRTLVVADDQIIEEPAHGGGDGDGVAHKAAASSNAAASSKRAAAAAAAASPRAKPAFFAHDDNVVCLAASALADQVRVAVHPCGLYGLWHAVDFTTLKPIALYLRAVGSESAVFQWDTGASADASSSRRTAITAFNVKVFPVGIPGEERNATLRDAAATGHIVRGLEPSTRYSASVRVCYEDVQWGGWSESVHLSTLELLQARISTLEENLARVLVWRETGPNTPPITSHQLIVNGVMCPDPFEIERGASTVLTMDSIALDSEFTLEIADFVCAGEWQRAKEVLRFESLPHPVCDLRLTARREHVYSIEWAYDGRMSKHTQYVFWLQRAVVGPRALSRGVDPEFTTLATLTDRALELELPAGVSIDWYLFRLRVAKLRQTVDGEPLPQGQLTCVAPHSILPHLDPAQLRWSTWSPPLRLPQPKPPEEPHGLHIRRIHAHGAELHWAPCRGNGPADAVRYHVFLCAHVEGAMSSCVGTTTDTHLPMSGLMASTRYKVHVVAENNFGRSASLKKVNFTTRFDPNDLGGGGGSPLGGGGMMMMLQQRGAGAAAAAHQQQQQQQQRGAADGEANFPTVAQQMTKASTASLLRNIRGLPNRT